MTERNAFERLDAMGYDVVAVLAVKGDSAVWRDTCGNVRVKNLADGRYRGLRGVFYANHNGRGETAVEAALASIG
jgi:hypothetical protein